MNRGDLIVDKKKSVIEQRLDDILKVGGLALKSNGSIKELSSLRDDIFVEDISEDNDIFKLDNINDKDDLLQIASTDNTLDEQYLKKLP